MKNYIDVTDADLIKLIQEAYNLSAPQGLGFLHFTADPLSDEEAQQLIDSAANDRGIAAGLDYVKGRACKLTVFIEDDKRWICNSWYDHNDAMLDLLLERVGIDREALLDKDGKDDSN